MAAIRARVSTFEKFISFSGLCSIIGVVGDLLTPVGSYTTYALLAGIGMVVIGLIAIPVLGFRSSMAQTLLLFGTILSVISVFFVVNSHGSDKGYAAEKISWVSDAQKELLGIQEATGRIADNTDNIARTSEETARNTAMTHHLNYSEEGFRSARGSLDEETIALYCSRGYRASHISEIYLDKISENRDPARRFAILNAHRCIDSEKLCTPSAWSEMWHDLSGNLDEAKVEAVCGASGLQTLLEHKAEIEINKREADEAFLAKQAEYKACLAEADADPIAASFCIEPRRFP